MSSSGASATSGSRLFMSMRRAASCCQPLQLIAVPRGARTALAPVRAPLPCVCPLVGIAPPSLHLAASSNTSLGHRTRQVHRASSPTCRTQVAGRQTAPAPCRSDVHLDDLGHREVVDL